MKMTLQLIQKQICAVCQQDLGSEKRKDDLAEIAFFGAEAGYSICPSCLQCVSKKLQNMAYKNRYRRLAGMKKFEQG